MISQLAASSKRATIRATQVLCPDFTMQTSPSQLHDDAVRAFLETRRSSRPMQLSAPGPTPDQTADMLKIASRVPDHKKLAPWRFVTFEGDARTAFGSVLVEALVAENDEVASETRRETERSRFERAPLVVAAIASPRRTDVVPEIEQVLSAGAATFSLCLAANALGFGAAWVTEWYSYSPTVARALNLEPSERIAGFVYIGTRTETQSDRDRPDLTDIVSSWSPV